MPRSLMLRKLALALPRPFPGPALHRLGLVALHARDYAAADALFEHAALKYRERVMVQPLARLRVHQLIARALATGGSESDVALEVERRLYRLDRIETLHPPFAIADARLLLAGWAKAADSHPPAPVDEDIALPDAA